MKLILAIIQPSKVEAVKEALSKVEVFRLTVSDVVADEDMDEATRQDMEQWTGCVAGALTQDEYRYLLAAAGLSDVDVEVTHRVHPHAASAIIRASKPGPANQGRNAHE